MNEIDCLNKLREIKDVAVATVDANDLPRVRIIDVMLVEDGKLYFCTARGKSFYRELIRKPFVAIAGLTKDYVSIRYHGCIKRLSNQKYWIDRIFLENPSMNHVYPQESRYILEAFCIEKGELEYFNLSTVPIERKKFGRANDGYEILDSCIGCGKCAKNCPQKCIEKNTPYKIKEENCLHCGLCYENCPVKAILRKV